MLIPPAPPPPRALPYQHKERLRIPFKVEIVLRALSTRNVLMPEKLATFGNRVTYLKDKVVNVQRKLFFGDTTAKVRSQRKIFSSKTYQSLAKSD